MKTSSSHRSTAPILGASLAMAVLGMLPGGAKAAEVDLPTGWHFSGTFLPISGGYTSVNGTLTKAGQPTLGLSNTTAATPDRIIYQANGQLSLNNGSYQPFDCTFNSATGASNNSTCLTALQSLFTNQQLSAAQQAARQAQVVQTQRSETRQTVNLIGRRISAALAPGARFAPATADKQSGTPVAMDGRDGFAGMSAGDGAYTKSLWGTYSHSWIANNWQALKSTTDLDTGILGGDVKIKDNLLAGFSFTYQRSGGRTNYNDGTLDSSAYTFVPYAALSLLDNRLVLDAMAGYGFGDSDTTRSRSLGGIKGAYGEDRWLMATHATVNHTVDKLNLSAKLGWMMTYSWANSFTESNNTVNSAVNTKVGEISIGGRAGYALDQFEPYIGATYSYDAILTPNNVGLTNSSLGRHEIEALIGVNWMANDRVTASIELSNAFLRRNEDNTTLLVSGRYTF